MRDGAPGRLDHALDARQVLHFQPEQRDVGIGAGDALDRGDQVEHRFLGRRAAISAPKPAVLGASCTITQRPVLLTDSAMVAKSSGRRVATSMTSALMPSLASLSAASRASFTCAPQVTRVTSVPSRST